MSLQLVPVELSDANAFVERLEVQISKSEWDGYKALLSRLSSEER